MASQDDVEQPNESGHFNWEVTQVPAEQVTGRHLLRDAAHFGVKTQTLLTHSSLVQASKSSHPLTVVPQTPVSALHSVVKHPVCETGAGHFGVTLQEEPPQEDNLHLSEGGRTH